MPDSKNQFHKEVLTREQVELLPLVKLFKKSFGLVGGTAIALYIGHRGSIDFDLFTDKEFDNYYIRRKIAGLKKIERTVRDEEGQFTLLINGVRFTFFNFPFKINFSEKFDDFINLPDLLTLSAMKAYALGRRPKWKDYVDLYFSIRDYYSLKEIAKKAREIFGPEFNEKMFRGQLAYFKDINYSEKIIYRKGFKVDDKIIKKELIKFSLS